LDCSIAAVLFIGVLRINGDYYGFDPTLSVTMEWLDFGLISSVVPLPKLPARFKKLLWDFRVVGVVVFPR
jgi:hypothetical protein